MKKESVATYKMRLCVAFIDNSMLVVMKGEREPRMGFNMQVLCQANCCKNQ